METKKMDRIRDSTSNNNSGTPSTPTFENGSKMNEDAYNGNTLADSISSLKLKINDNNIPSLNLGAPDHSSSPQPIPKLAHSDSFGIRRRSRTPSNSSDVRPELIRTTSASSNMTSPPALVRKASENAMLLRELNNSSSGSPPVLSYMQKRLSYRGNASSTPSSPSSPSSSNSSSSSSSVSSSVEISSPVPVPASRYTLMSGAYQRTSQSAGNLILSRPTTPTLPANELSSPRGNNNNNHSPRSGSPDYGQNLLPRSASDQTPKKKSVDDFHIGKVLGEGSYGAVVEGIDKETGSQYAIKILEKKHILKENKVKYVTTERDILGTCFHHGIVKLFYTFKSETSLYYVLELCPNGELLGQIKQYGGLEEECVKFYTAEIIEALEYLHSKGVVHRDLKPENILLSADWHIKLTDFGTAKILGTERNARSNSFVGTAEYVSPELISIKETSCASDLWALGSIVYQMFANRLPFRGKTEFLTFNKISSRDLAFPVNFPPLAKDLVENLLQLKPEERIGARIGGYEELKNHPFFKGINWGSLKDQKPPPMRKPLITLIFDEMSPPPSPNANQLLLRTGSSGYFNYNGNNSNNSSPTSSPRRADAETQKWIKYLTPEESVKISGLVWKRKGLSIKKRYLILTNAPRLFYVEPKKMTVRGEIPWSEHLRPELKNSANFYIHTPKRKYILEDTSNNAQKWVEQIQAVLIAYKNR